MKFALIFLGCSGTALYLAFGMKNLYAVAILINCAIAFLILGLAYLFDSPAMLLKRSDGSLHFFAYVLLWPYLLANWMTLALFRAVVRSPPFQEIVPGIHLGCRLRKSDVPAFRALGIKSVLDVTAEFREPQLLKPPGAYLCIPVLDTRAPSMSQLSSGIGFIADRLSKGPVYVHCALGHGRSATFVIAYLLSTGSAKNPGDGLACVQRKRPGVKLHPDQTKVLNQLIAKPNA
jgi:protein-tyrosine phosphatase